MALSLDMDTTRAAEIFHALSDPIRLDVITLLMGGERCVCELTDSLDLAQSRLSWHLKTLKDADLLTDRREGRWIYYALNPEALAEAREILGALKPSTRRLAVREACCD